jgi:hypothetical protein
MTRDEIQIEKQQADYHQQKAEEEEYQKYVSRSGMIIPSAIGIEDFLFF